MKKLAQKLQTIFISLLFLTLISCEGLFQMLTTTPDCIDAVDFGDIVSVRVGLKVNPEDWGNANKSQDPTLRCPDSTRGWDGYKVEYFNTGVDYTSTNNPLSIKASGFGTFCSASFDSGYEKSEDDSCDAVDCDTDSDSSCCSLSIEEEGSSCQTSLITFDSSLPGEQPLGVESEFACSPSGGSNSSFYFNNAKEFLVLVPKLCIPGSEDKCDGEDEYKDKKVGGSWEDCSACTTGNLAGCENCSCVLRSFVCDTASGATVDENGLCDCDGVEGCSEDYIEVVKYTPDQIDFANSSFDHIRTDSFTMAGNVGDGVCSNFEYLVAQTYSDLKDMSTNNGWGYTDPELQRMSLDSIQLGFVTDMADNLTAETYDANRYKAIMATKVGTERKEPVFLKTGCDISGCNLTRHSCSLLDSSGDVSEPNFTCGDNGGASSIQCSTSESAYKSKVEACSRSRLSYQGCITNVCEVYRDNADVGICLSHCEVYRDNADVDSCLSYCEEGYVGLGYADADACFTQEQNISTSVCSGILYKNADDCFTQEQSISTSVCNGIFYKDFGDCVEHADECARDYRAEDEDGASCYSQCKGKSDTVGNDFYGDIYSCITVDSAFCIAEATACLDVAVDQTEKDACTSEQVACTENAITTGCPRNCDSSSEDTEWANTYADCCASAGGKDCLTDDDGNDTAYWNSDDKKVYLYDPNYIPGNPAVQFRLGGTEGSDDNRWVYLSDSEIFTLLDGTTEDLCECLFDKDKDCPEEGVCHDISVSGIDIKGFDILHYNGQAVNGWAKMAYVKPYAEVKTCDPAPGDNTRYKGSRPFDPHWFVSNGYAWDYDSVDADLEWDLGDGYGEGCWEYREAWKDMSFRIPDGIKDWVLTWKTVTLPIRYHHGWKWRGSEYIYNNYDNNRGTGAVIVRLLETCTGGDELVRIKIGDDPEVTLEALAKMSSAKSIPSIGRIKARVVDSFEQDDGECFVHNQTQYDYIIKNNAGNFLLSITTMEDEIDPVNVIALILEPFDYLFAADFQESAFGELVGEGSYFQTILRTVLALYISYMGLLFVIGLANISQGELFAKIIRIGIIYMFVSPGGWEFFYTYIIQFFEGGAEDLAEIFTYSLRPELEGDELGLGGSFAVFDYFFYYLFQEVILTKLVAILFSPLLIGWLLFALVLGGVFCVLVAIVKVYILYVFAKVILAILFIIGPIFFIFLVFDSTKEFFRNWLNMVISYSLQLAMLFFVVNIFGFMLLAALFDVFSFGVCWSNILSITLPGIPPFEMLSFWKAAGIDPRYSTAYNASRTVSFYAAAYFFALGYFFMRFTDTITALADSIAGGGADGSSLGSIAGDLTKDVIPAMKFAAGKLGKHGFRAAAFGGKLAYKTAAPVIRNAVGTGVSSAKALKSGAASAGYSARSQSMLVAANMAAMGGNVNKANRLGRKSRALSKASSESFERAKKHAGKAASSGLKTVIGVTTNLPGNIGKSVTESKPSKLRREFGEATGHRSREESRRHREQGRRFKSGVDKAVKGIKGQNLSDSEKLGKLRAQLGDTFRGDEQKVNNYMDRNHKGLIKKMGMRQKSDTISDTIGGEIEAMLGKSKESLRSVMEMSAAMVVGKENSQSLFRKGAATGLSKRRIESLRSGMERSAAMAVGKENAQSLFGKRAATGFGKYKEDVNAAREALAEEYGRGTEEYMQRLDSKKAELLDVLETDGDPFEIYQKERERYMLALKSKPDITTEEAYTKALKEEEGRLKDEISDRIKDRGIDGSAEMAAQYQAMADASGKAGSTQRSEVNQAEFSRTLEGKDPATRERRTDSAYRGGQTQFLRQKRREQADIADMRGHLGDVVAQAKVHAEKTKEAADRAELSEYDDLSQKAVNAAEVLERSEKKLEDFNKEADDRMALQTFKSSDRRHDAKIKMASKGKSFYNVSSTNMVEDEIFRQKVEHQKFMSGFRVEEEISAFSDTPRPVLAQESGASSPTLSPEASSVPAEARDAEGGAFDRSPPPPGPPSHPRDADTLGADAEPWSAGVGEEKGTGPDLERKISDAEGRLQDCEMQLRVLDAKPRPLSTEDERKASGLRSEASSARSRLAALRSRSV